jgi:hypothetical protein
MHTLKNYNILYINLDHRKDRKKYIESQLRSMHLMKRKNYITKRISGVLGTKIDTNHIQLAKEFNVRPEQMKESFWLSRKNFKTMSNNKTKVLGRVGCFLGHLRALQYAHKYKLKKVIILEDDCTFIQNETFQFPPPPKDNDIFYIGGLFRHMGSTITPIRIQNDWLTINPKKIKFYCAFSYGFTNLKSITNAKILFESVWLPGKGKDKPNDWTTGKEKIRANVADIMYVNFIQKYGTSYVLIQPICMQSDAFISDVTDFGKKTPKMPSNLSYFYNKKYEKLYHTSLNKKNSTS